MIADIEDYFAKGCGRCPRFATSDCSTRIWAEGLAALRRLCLGAGLGETVKWGHPCYVHAGRNVAIIGAFRGDFRLSFFDAARLTDPARLLTRQGPNTAHADAIRFTDAAQLAERAPHVLAYLREAMALAEGGPAPRRPAAAPDLPDELAAALDADPALAEAFAALTPGRQRSHALAVGSAKAPATRAARVARLRPLILAGRGATER